MTLMSGCSVCDQIGFFNNIIVKDSDVLRNEILQTSDSPVMPFCSWLEASNSGQHLHQRGLGSWMLFMGNEDESGSTGTPVTPSLLIQSLSGFRDSSSLIKSCMTLSSWKVVSSTSLRPYESDHYRLLTPKTSGNLINKINMILDNANTQIETPNTRGQERDTSFQGISGESVFDHHRSSKGSIGLHNLKGF